MKMKMPPVKKMKAAIYARANTGDEAAVLGQIERCKAVIRKKGWKHLSTHCFSDRDTSANDKNKPALTSLKLHAKRGAFNVLLITSTDRLFRDNIAYFKFAKELERCGVRIQVGERALLPASYWLRRDALAHRAPQVDAARGAILRLLYAFEEGQIPLALFRRRLNALQDTVKMADTALRLCHENRVSRAGKGPLARN
jgi:hypothetical protein